MAKNKNKTSNFKYDFKNREIKQVDVIKRNDQLAIYKIIFGEEMTKISKNDLILEKLNKIEIKIDNLTDAVVELQGEAKNHGWDIKKEIKNL